MVSEDLLGVTQWGSHRGQTYLLYSNGHLELFPDGKVVLPERIPAAVAALIAALQTAPLLLLARRPLVGLAAGAAAIVALSLSYGWFSGERFTFFPVQLAMVLLMVSAIWRHRPIIGATAWLLTLGALAPGMNFAYARIDYSQPGIVVNKDLASVNLVPGMLLVSAIAAIAALIKLSLHLGQRLNMSTVAREQEQARRTALEERTHLARELHDVVAHRMSLIAVQARSAPHRIADLPAAGRAEFSAIGENASAALTEIRTLLGVLRSDEAAAVSGPDDELVPQPGAADIAGLLEGTRRAGVPVQWEITGDLETISAASGLALFRIVQESLANAARHASGQEITIGIEVTDTTILLRVSNDTELTEHRPGHGIAGMIERAKAIGGNLTISGSGQGQFIVRAELPTVPAADTD